MNDALAPLLQPLTIKGVTIRNRILSTAHSSGFVKDGFPQEQYRLYQREKARGGIGMTMIAGTSSVTPDSPGREAGHVDISTDAVIPYFKALAATIRAEGAAVMAQVGHMGRRIVWDKDNWLPVISASRVREPTNHAFPKEMEDWDIRRVVKAFGAAALRCKQGDMQGVEVGGGYMHLVQQFLSPLSNTRTDGYGGSLENRLRFLVEILEEMRLRVGDDYVIGARISVDELRKDGMPLEDGLRIASMLNGRGVVDYLSIVGGEAQDHISHPPTLPGMSFPVAPFLSLASRVKREVDVPVFHAQRITDVAVAARAVAEGHVDMVGMTRPHMADPYIVRKMIEGRLDDIRPCIGSNYCIDRFYIRGQARCIHNAATGREAEIPQRISRADVSKRILVIGGGVGGLEAGRVGAERGHAVTLLERSDRLGGQVNIAARAPRHEALANVVGWLELQVRKLGVDVRLQTEGTADAVSGFAPDVVIVATGGQPNRGRIKGAEHVTSTWDILSGAVPLGEEVLVFDDNGEHQAPMTAEFIAQRGTKVEFVTHDRAMGQDIGLTEAALYRRELYKMGVIFTPDHRLIEVYPEGNRLVAVLQNSYTFAEEEREVDQVVVENGTLPNEGLYFDLKSRSRNLGEVDYQALIDGRHQDLAPNPDGSFQLFRIGDAMVSRNIHGTIYEAIRLVLHL
jgi:2,4-dienoyl-CoA reductase-like NADH-dependent reductase (Old Yellow Enzyme family)/thioredoxin reductase